MSMDAEPQVSMRGGGVIGDWWVVSPPLFPPFPPRYFPSSSSGDAAGCVARPRSCRHLLPWLIFADLLTRAPLVSTPSSASSAARAAASVAARRDTHVFKSRGVRGWMLRLKELGHTWHAGLGNARNYWHAFPAGAGVLVLS